MKRELMVVSYHDPISIFIQIIALNFSCCPQKDLSPSNLWHFKSLLYSVVNSMSQKIVISLNSNMSQRYSYYQCYHMTVVEVL
jgi:hypothetical protein